MTTPPRNACCPLPGSSAPLKLRQRPGKVTWLPLGTTCGKPMPPLTLYGMRLPARPNQTTSFPSFIVSLRLPKKLWMLVPNRPITAVFAGKVLRLVPSLPVQQPRRQGLDFQSCAQRTRALWRRIGRSARGDADAAMALRRRAAVTPTHACARCRLHSTRPALS